MRKQAIFFSIFIVIVTTILGVFFRLNIYEEYLILFRKSGIVGPVDKDGRLNGEIRMYTNGIIKEETSFLNGVRQGRGFTFYENGILESKFNFVNNNAEGVEYQYYRNGRLNYKGNVLHGRRYGELFWYGIDGHLEQCVTYDINSSPFYLEQYNTSGKIDSISGILVSPTIFTLDRKSNSFVALGQKDSNIDFRDLYVTIATSHRVNFNFTVQINNKTFSNLALTNNTIIIKNAFPTKGSYLISVITYLPDREKKLRKLKALESIVNKH